MVFLALHLERSTRSSRKELLRLSRTWYVVTGIPSPDHYSNQPSHRSHRKTSRKTKSCSPAISAPGATKTKKTRANHFTYSATSIKRSSIVAAAQSLTGSASTLLKASGNSLLPPLLSTARSSTADPTLPLLTRVPHLHSSAMTFAKRSTELFPMRSSMRRTWAGSSQLVLL